jgi:hypothetical protein
VLPRLLGCRVGEEVAVGVEGAAAIDLWFEAWVETSVEARTVTWFVNLVQSLWGALIRSRCK